MSAVQLNTASSSPHAILYKKVEVQLTFCDRVTKFALALLATLPFFIGLCFKSIRAYWVQAWTGKTTVLEKMAPPQPALVAPPKVVIPAMPAVQKPIVPLDIPAENKPVEVKADAPTSPAPEPVRWRWIPRIIEALPGAAHSAFLATAKMVYLAALIRQRILPTIGNFALPILAFDALYEWGIVSDWNHQSTTHLMTLFVLSINSSLENEFFCLGIPLPFPAFYIVGSAVTGLTAKLISNRQRDLLKLEKDMLKLQGKRELIEELRKYLN